MSKFLKSLVVAKEWKRGLKLREKDYPKSSGTMVEGCPFPLLASEGPSGSRREEMGEWAREVQEGFREPGRVRRTEMSGLALGNVCFSEEVQEQGAMGQSGELGRDCVKQKASRCVHHGSLCVSSCALCNRQGR